MVRLTFALKAWPLIGQSLEDKTAATMSVQEASLPFKPQAKPRPDVAPKQYPAESSSPPLEGNTGSTPDLSTGKVKSIVNKFSLQNSVSNDPEDRATNGAAKVKRFKRPPTVKPKPGRARLPSQIGGEQAPPLPIKRSQKLKDGEQVDESNGISAEEGGRSGISDSLWWMYDAAGSSSFWQIAAVGAAVFPLKCRNDPMSPSRRVSPTLSGRCRRKLRFHQAAQLVHFCTSQLWSYDCQQLWLKSKSLLNTVPFLVSMHCVMALPPCSLDGLTAVAQ